MLSTLTKSDLVEIVDSLVKEGVLSEERAMQILVNHPTTETKHVADKLHSVFCTRDHSNDCNWYNEDQLGEDAWRQEAHESWLKIARETMKDLNLNGETFFKAFYPALSAFEICSQAYHKLDGPTKKLFEMLWNRTMFTG